ncbi:MAG: hypothetical protein HYR76_04350, partial [Ignavibacteria bacterium]|nr:hypothetical protein [Ignavibacteria bacterium]
MRFSTTFLGLLVVSSMLFAQQKVVITSAGDIVPLKKGASSIDAARATGLINDRTSSTSSCGNTTSFGFKSNLYPCNLPFVGYHHDVWGQWFVCPSDGSIDSVYISTNDQNEMASGTAKLRIFQSNITPSVGPGHGPYHSPRHSWGYYKKANLSDEDFGATPFKDAATDTHWIPTNFTTDSLIATGVDDGAANPSFDPLGDELWGLGGWPHVFTINSINGIGMLELGYKPDVTKDQSIFLTLEQLGTHTPAGAGGNNAGPATWCMSSQGIPDPSVNWKFYEHSTAGNRGWHARSEASWIWWMVMTVTADIPPDINSLDRLSHTLSTGPRTVYTHLQDCNPGHPDSAGIASATFTYSIDGAAEVTIPMTFDGGDQYHASIPGGSPEDHNYYYITVTDIKGNVTTSAKIKYTIIALRNAYYSLDTAATYNWVELSGDAGANKVASSAFFNPRGTQGPATDDGTAGPVNMGFSFKFFDITDRYAWLGANGGIALSDTTSDTLQINGAGGSFPGNWQFPSSVVPNVDMPKNFIAALCNDYNLAPKSTDAPYAHGYVWWKTDGTKFICEWDSVGVVSKLIPDTLNSFELILDNSDGSITYQYKDISGGVRLDTSALVGLQKDSLDNHWLMVNKENNPPELKPRNGKAFRFSRTVATLTAADGWNLLSVPGSSTNLSKSYIFPTAASAAFRYQAGYIPTDPLDHERGFWVKFNGAQTIFIPGQNQFSVMPSAGGENTVNSTTTIIINVVAGWNMI